MRKGLLGSLTALLVGGSMSFAQTPTNQAIIRASLGAPETGGQFLPTSLKTPEPTVPKPPAPAESGLFVANGPSTPRSWGDVSYRLWRFTSAPLPVPLVTTSDPGDFGILGNPSTQVLAGGSSYSGGWQSGYNLTVGNWVNDERLVGIEASGFYFQPRNTTIFAGATSDPTQILTIPFVNVTPGGTSGAVPGTVGTGGFFTPFVKTKGGESALAISGVNFIRLGGNMGATAVTSSSNFWGTELNGVFNVRRTDNGQINFLLGFRYVDLLESLNMDSQSLPSVVGANFGPLLTATIHDHFGTRNQAYAGQFGLKGEWSNGLVFVNAVGKFAMGVNHETVDINGSFADPLPVLYRIFGAGAGGLFATQTNSGRQNHNHFIVIPEVGVQAGINVTCRIRVFAGYDAVYLSNVVRPGSQVDRNINLTQVGTAVSVQPGAVPSLVGPANPVPQFNQSSFWAQGVSFGLEYRY